MTRDWELVCRRHLGSDHAARCELVPCVKDWDKGLALALATFGIYLPLYTCIHSILSPRKEYIEKLPCPHQQ